MQLVPIAPEINGYSYGWSDIILTIGGGTPVIGITSIEYSTTRKSVPVYGAGSQPISYGYGNVEYKGSITIKLEELTAIRAVAPFGDITQIPPFPIVVTWLDQNNLIVVNTLNLCQFLSDDMKTKQDDTSIDMAIPLLIGSIVY